MPRNNNHGNKISENQGKYDDDYDSNGKYNSNF
jgi:hypothetical protein